MDYKNKNSGFTLIELLVVVAILGLLSSIILMTTWGVVAKARDGKRKMDLRNLALAIEKYNLDNGDYLPDCLLGSFDISFPNWNSNAEIQLLTSNIINCNMGTAGTKIINGIGAIGIVPKDPINNNVYKYKADADDDCQDPSCAAWPPDNKKGEMLYAKMETKNDYIFKYSCGGVSSQCPASNIYRVMVGEYSQCNLICHSW